MVNTAYDSPVDFAARGADRGGREAAVRAGRDRQIRPGLPAVLHALTDAIDMAANAYQRDGGLSGLATGFTDLDQQDGRPAALRPDHPRRPPLDGQDGARHQHRLQRRQGLSRGRRQPTARPRPVDGAVVGFFSLEMSAEQLATRIISEQADIPSEQHPPRHASTPTSSTASSRSSQEMQHLPLYIDQTGGISVAQLAARARRLKRQRGLGFIVVDYLQLLSGSSKRAAEGRVQEVSEITTGLKALAKELHVPVLALSQLSRQVEKREDKRPQLADLRESGSIEQDADVVMFVFREEYYLERSQAPREHRRAPAVEGRDGAW